MRRLLILFVAGLCASIAFCEESSQLVKDRVNWPEFLARHDLVWQKLPDRWENGAFTGNGLLGAMIYAPDKAKGPGLRWHIGRSDVTFRTNRIPIGDLLLKPAGKIESCAMRLDLWNAEVTGKLKTDKGEISVRSFTHADEIVQIIELHPSGGEEGCTFEWIGGLAANPRSIVKKEKIPDADVNPEPVASEDGGMHVSLQALRGEGEHATAWTVVKGEGGAKVLYLSVGFSAKSGEARKMAVDAVRRAAGEGLAKLVSTHRDWWNKYWPASFVSIPDTRMESFYWIQMYKLASATRADRPAIDLMGPWFRGTPWPKIWWNLNIQLTYWPVLGANRLELGESLCRMLDNNISNLSANAKQFSDDSATIARTSSYDCKGAGGGELCNLPWTVHNYWLQYRFSMDDQRLREKLFPLLKRSINYYIHQLETGPDGKFHIKGGSSPEYPMKPGTNGDCNIDLGLLRWGCQALLDICARLKIDDPLVPKWKEVLEKLTPYPVDANGLMVSAKQPFAESHRHYSHLLMIYPLYIMNPEQKENVALINKSVDHWMGMPQALQGYSFTGASSICAAVGRRDDAVMYLNRLLDKKIHPNTMYTESGPVIETPLSGAQSLNDILLSSWGGMIRVFPGVPDGWKDVTIHNMRTEGAFLVSAVKKDGKTQWVRVRSLAGEPCRIKPSLSGSVKAANSGVAVKSLGDDAYELALRKGEEILLYSGDKVPDAVVVPVAAAKEKCNYYGLKGEAK